MVGKRSRFVCPLHDGRGSENEARGDCGIILLDFEELNAGLRKLAAEAAAVKAEVGDGAAENFAGFDHGDDVRDVLVVAGQADEVRFHGGNAIDAPGEVGEGTDEVKFADRLGVVLVEESLEVDLVKLGVLAGDDGGLAGESVAESVHRRSLFAFGGARTGGFLRVQAVDIGTSHMISPIRGYGLERGWCGE